MFRFLPPTHHDLMFWGKWFNYNNINSKGCVSLKTSVLNPLLPSLLPFPLRRIVHCHLKSQLKTFPKNSMICVLHVVICSREAEGNGQPPLMTNLHFEIKLV